MSVWRWRGLRVRHNISPQSGSNICNIFDICTVTPANVGLARPKRQTQHKSPRVETQRCQVDLQETTDQFDLEKNNQPRRSEINDKEKVHLSKPVYRPRTPKIKWSTKH